MRTKEILCWCFFMTLSISQSGLERRSVFREKFSSQLFACELAIECCRMLSSQFFTRDNDRTLSSQIVDRTLSNVINAILRSNVIERCRMLSTLFFDRTSCAKNFRRAWKTLSLVRKIFVAIGRRTLSSQFFDGTLSNVIVTILRLNVVEHCRRNSSR